MKLTEITKPKRALSPKAEDWFMKHAIIVNVGSFNDGSTPLYTGEAICTALNKGVPENSGPCKLFLEFYHETDEEYSMPPDFSVDLWTAVFGDQVKHQTVFNGILKDPKKLFTPAKLLRLYLNGAVVESVKFPPSVNTNSLNFEDVKIKCGLLNLMKTENIKTVHGFNEADNDVEKAFEIVNKHLKEGKDIIECQSDLIDAGFEKWAKV